MIDEKNPRQESVEADSSEDEVIIDLTDEVNVKTDDDNDVLRLSKDMIDDAPQAVEDDWASEDEEDEEVLAQDKSDNLESQEEESVIDLNDQAAEDQVQFGDDRLIASAMENTLRADKDDTEEMTEQFDLNSLENTPRADKDDTEEMTEQFDLSSLENTLRADKDDTEEMTEQFDLNSLENTLRADKDDTEEMTEQFDLSTFDEEDILIVDNTQDEADENIYAMDGDEPAETQRNEDVFNLEEEIELEFESDEDEDELIELDDERAEDNQDFVDLMLGVSKESDQSDDDDEPTEYLEFGTEKRDDIIVPDADRDPDTEIIALAEDEAPEFVDSDDLPDLEAISGLDFEIEEDEEDSLAIDEHETDSSDDIIARAVEQSLGSDDDREPVDLADEAEFGLEDDDALLDLDGSQENDEEILALAEEEPLSLENDEDLLDWDAETDLEADDEIIPLDGFNDLEAEDGEDIIEITEFDQHFPADSEALLKQSGILDASGADEEDFLELIDIEEDSLSDDEEIIEFSDSPATIENDKINQFFSDDLEEDRLETETPEPIFSADRADKTLENELTDFDFDPNSIAQQVDRLDTFLSEDAVDEPEAASLPVDQVAAEEEIELEKSQTGLGMDELPAVPAGQIDAAIERVIIKKFSGKIEDIIYEVIEKAVAKEIDRLKGALMGSNTFDDNQD